MQCSEKVLFICSCSSDDLVRVQLKSAGRYCVHLLQLGAEPSARALSAPVKERRTSLSIGRNIEQPEDCSERLHWIPPKRHGLSPVWDVSTLQTSLENGRW